MADWRDHAGAVIVAYGEPALKCFERAESAWRKHMPDVPLALVSDAPVGAEDVFLEHPDDHEGARNAKLAVYDLAPAKWRYVLYMDADTELQADVSYLYDVLTRGWEFVICRHWGEAAVTRWKRMYPPDEYREIVRALGSEYASTMQCGVFGFRRTAAVKRLFASWQAEWHRWEFRDQGPFLRALYQHPVKLWTLPSNWNRRDNHERKARDPTYIVHHSFEARRGRAGSAPGKRRRRRA